MSTQLGFTTIVCLLTPFQLLWTLFYMNCGLMLCVMSTDRLLFILFPLWYLSQGTRVAKLMIGAVVAHGVAFYRESDKYWMG